MTDTGTNDARLTVLRVISAPRERVFRSWTEPEQLRRWWGPGGFTCPEALVDLRPGGIYRLVMQPERGPMMSVTGLYQQVEPPSLLVYTWRWDSGPAASEHESLVTVTFDDLGDDRTQVTVTHDRFPPDHGAAPYRSGWEEGLEKLERTVLKGDEGA
jgi:uncharacterized protein YndB with AHSA1/START domain